MRLIISAFVWTGLAAADDCSELCRRDSRCVRGSWCKGDSVRGSCHNFFYDSSDKSGSFHYHVHGMTSVHPVLCGEARGLIDRISTIVSTTTTAVPTTGRVPSLSVVNMPVISVGASTPRPSLGQSTTQTPTNRSYVGVACSAVCESVPTCREAGRGSFCKPNGTCSGLFFRTREMIDVCYHRSGSDCPDVYPVTCNPATGKTMIVSHASIAPTDSAVTTNASPTTQPIARAGRAAADSLASQVNGRSFRSTGGELGVIVSFENPHLRLEFTYRSARTIVEGLEYVIEGNFVHLQRGSSLRVLIDTVESIGAAITHHRHSAHHVTIHIVPAGTVQNESTYVIVRLGDLAPVTCTAF